MATGLRTGLAALVTALCLVLTSCAGSMASGPPDYTGTWQLAGQDGTEPAQFVVSVDGTYTARGIPDALACRTRNADTSPPGCSEGRSSSDFSGQWTLADGSAPGIRFRFADRFVRQGYPTDAGLAFFTGSLDVPRPDFVFVRIPAR